MSNAYVYWLLFESAVFLSLFFLPSLIAIISRNPLYLSVLVWNVLIGWTGLGWLYLLYKVWPTPFHMLVFFFHRLVRRSRLNSPFPR
jgi:CHASE2 domain-containing sensor protein